MPDRHEVCWTLLHDREVPPGDDWLGPTEREVQAGLRLAVRREAWRRGRAAAKALLADVLVTPHRGRATPSARFEIVADADGVPHVRDGGRPGTASTSISHRAAWALAAVAPAEWAVGCDLEVIEPRSPAFVATWLSSAERAHAEAADHDPLVVNALWVAKEATAKALGAGLRLDVGRATVHLDAGDEPGWTPVGVGNDHAAELGSWQPLRVDWPDLDTTMAGWWAHGTGLVAAVAAATG